MKNEMILRMRDEYAALVRVADGLMDMLRGNCPCNMLTFARMAEQARRAARQLASAIERLLIEERPAQPVRKASFIGRAMAAAKAVVALCKPLNV